MNKYYVTHLECSMTGKKYPANEIQGLSEAGRPLLVRYDLEKIKKEEEKVPKSVPSPDLSSHDDLNHQKKQYCYVGNLGGKRHCAEIEQSDKCISGDIFPTESLCVNPNLRK